MPNAEHAAENHFDHVQLVCPYFHRRANASWIAELKFWLCFFPSLVQVRQRHGVHWTELLRPVVGAKSVFELFVVVRRGGTQLPSVLAPHGSMGSPVAAVSGDDVERYQLHRHCHFAAR